MDQLRALRVFVRVVGEGSFAGAARALDLAPALVTRAIAELEGHLGARLLNRTTRRLALTEIGTEYLARATRVLAELDDADALAGASARRPQGTLRVLCPPAFAVHQLARCLPAFRERYPKLSLEVSAPGPVDLADEHFDVSIVSIGERALEGGFVARRLARSSFIVCASPAYLDRRGRPQTPDDLPGHEAVLPAVAAVRHGLVLTRADVAGGDAPATAPTATVPLPPPALSTSHIELILSAAVAGLGIAGLPSFVAAQALREGRLERVLPAWRGATLTLYAAVPSRRQMPARTRAFVDFLVATFGGSDRDPWLP